MKSTDQRQLLHAPFGKGVANPMLFIAVSSAAITFLVLYRTDSTPLWLAAILACIMPAPILVASRRTASIAPMSRNSELWKVLIWFGTINCATALAFYAYLLSQNKTLEYVAGFVIVALGVTIGQVISPISGAEVRPSATQSWLKIVSLSVTLIVLIAVAYLKWVPLLLANVVENFFLNAVFCLSIVSFWQATNTRKKEKVR